jgi:hypothetical protein
MYIASKIQGKKL